MPNGRFDYDLDNPQPVLSTIETWRQPDEEARARGRRAVLEPYRELAPTTAWAAGSSTGARTCPGSTTPRSTTTGRPMKNWWPFLFY